mmetsp:Transcript_180/g.464  ORF Transcript_180/g.464 Transcript_180/m.464 type:complete len:238 (-) Transcript_180:710-1423(-)
MYLRCSSRVVAPMHCRSPRESAGLNRLAMSSPPPPPRPTVPAPTSTCISSIMRITLPSASLVSASRLVTRVSSSPRSFAPAMRRPTSSERMRFPFRNSGHVSFTMLRASPSAIAVLPTPGSPSRMGLFFWRRARICMTRLTSLSRPMTGSMWPSAASAVRSVQNSSRAPLASFSPALAPRTALFTVDVPCSLSWSPRSLLRASFFSTSFAIPCLFRMLLTPPSSAVRRASAMCSGAR